VGQIDQDLKTSADDLMAFFAADVGDQTHTAGVVLILRMIEPLRCGDFGRTTGCIHSSLFVERISFDKSGFLFKRDKKDKATTRSPSTLESHGPMP
jgi:hypothetical protein